LHSIKKEILYPSPITLTYVAEGFNRFIYNNPSLSLNPFFRPKFLRIAVVLLAASPIQSKLYGKDREAKWGRSCISSRRILSGLFIGEE
jgi:hypothetical protein